MIKVIIVDDERIIREGIKKIVIENVPQLTVAGVVCNGKECLDFLETELVHLIITDVRMPYMDGLQLMKAVKEKNKEIGFIVISGYDDFQYCREALKQDAFDYLLKPVDKSELISTLKRFAIIFNDSNKSNEQNSVMQTLKGQDYAIDKKVIKDIKNFIRSNYQKEITLTLLSEEFYMNASYISQLFKKETQMTLTKYLTDFRIEKAKILLKDRNLKINEIAKLVGYESPKQFLLAFKKHSNMTPSFYRENFD